MAHLGVRFEELRQREAVRVVRGHAERQRLGAPQHEPGIKRAEDRPLGVLNEAKPGDVVRAEPPAAVGASRGHDKCFACLCEDVTTDDIENAFDDITYEKGASILRMFELYVGEDVFQRGIREYLTARAWGNATNADFVAAISKASGSKASGSSPR